MSAGGAVQIVFPTYSSTLDFVASSNPTCLIGGTVTTTCRFTSANRTLTIYEYGAVSAGVSSFFTVNQIRNPYSAAPKGGFTLYTLNGAFGKVDSYASTSSTFLFTVTSVASFTSIDLGRSNGVTTVSLTDDLSLTFTLNFPVDPACKVKITFPTDMPVTSDLTSVNGFSLFSGVATSDMSISGNVVTIKGCTGTDTADTGVAIILLSNMKNKGYV